MSRRKKFLDVDVLTMAKERLRHVYDIFDSAIYMFSGGKDSLVCIQLAKELHEELGLGPVKVVFRDEELIPQTVVDFVDEYRQKSWVDMRWYCLPLANNKFILGNHLDYIQWDPNREHMRPMPPWAISDTSNIDGPIEQHALDSLFCEGSVGKVAIVLGIRSSESLVRYRSVVNKLNENYICASPCKRANLVKPIYDWSENDVFKYFMEEEIPYCHLYRQQSLSGVSLRVSTPLHAEASKRIGTWRSVDPDFYQRMMDIFPEMIPQERYWDEYDTVSILERHAVKGWPGVEEYIQTFIPEGRMREFAKTRLKEFKMMALKQPEEYTPAVLLKAFTRGAIERTLMGQYKCKTP